MTGRTGEVFVRVQQDVLDGHWVARATWSQDGVAWGSRSTEPWPTPGQALYELGGHMCRTWGQGELRSAMSVVADELERWNRTMPSAVVTACVNQLRRALEP